MAVVIDHQKCDFCGTCVAVCAEDAIELKGSAIAIDDDKCTLCGSCIDICPVGAPEMTE